MSFNDERLDGAPAGSEDLQTKQGPTIAVALRYEEDDGAPIVVATGRGSLGDRIVDTAKEHGVAIDENPMLASALEHVPVDEPIPQELYQAVAEVIGWVLNARNSNSRHTAASAHPVESPTREH